MESKRMRLKTKEAITGYLFFLPGIIGLLVFTLGPILYSLYLSFTNFNIHSDPVWVGLRNYIVILTDDPLIFRSLGNTLYFVLLSVPLTTILGILLANLMNQKVKGISLFRTLFYLPSVVSGVAVALLWQWILDPNFGLINTFLNRLGIQGPLWLLDETWSRPSLVLMNLWAVGGVTMIYLAGLQGIPKSLYEAATIDGAGTIRKFFKITLPMLSPTIFFNVIMATIAGFQVFLQAFIMTGGGPNDSTLFYALYLYNRAFRDLQIGYASAMAWILLVITLMVTLILFRIGKKWVFYAN